MTVRYFVSNDCETPLNYYQNKTTENCLKYDPQKLPGNQPHVSTEGLNLMLIEGRNDLLLMTEQLLLYGLLCLTAVFVFCYHSNPTVFSLWTK